MHLQNEGFRFIDRAGHFTWCHQNQLQPGDIDCTDMSDEEFEAQVRRYPQHVQRTCDDGYPSCRVAEATGKWCEGRCAATN